MSRRLLAALLALALAAAGLWCQAFAEDDWRTKLRDAFGLTEDYAPEVTEAPTATQAPKATKAPKSTKAPKATRAPKKTKAPKATAKAQWSDPITDPQEIVNYLAAYGHLPDNFITKNEAKALGWDSSWNYVGDVAPGKSIGGDRFGNYEGQLPSARGRTWYECDTNYKGRKRGVTRLLYSSDGLYFYTDDHYNTFTQMYPEG